MLSESTIALCLFSIATTALAQQGQQATAYPNRPVRMICTMTPGGASDIVARIMATKLTEATGQPFIVDNRAGAGGVIGTDIVAKARGDGYTLLIPAGAHTIVPFLYSNVPYDVYRDFKPVTQLGNQPYVLVVGPSVNANTVQELIALAKAKPGSLNAAIITGAPQLAAERFKMVTDAPIVSVTYKGAAQTITALVSNESQLLFVSAVPVVPFAKSGKLRVLAILGQQRLASLPDVPTMAEAGIKDFNYSSWQGLMVPAKTPAGIIDRLYGQVLKILSMPDTREKYALLGIDVIGNTPKEFGAFVNRELEQNRKIIKDAGIKAD